MDYESLFNIWGQCKIENYLVTVWLNVYQKNYLKNEKKNVIMWQRSCNEEEAKFITNQTVY